MTRKTVQRPDTNNSDFSAFGLHGKQVLITGAGRGLGAAMARGFDAAGARVIAVARSADELTALAAAVPGLATWTMDVTSDAFVERVQAMPALDVLVNNAGFNKPQPMQDVTPEVLDQMLNLNVRAVYRVSQAALAVMRRTQPGCIVNLSSQMGHVGSPHRSVYCMTKHAVEGLTKALAVELGPEGIRVNAVAPTFVETPLTKPMLDDPVFREFVLERIPLGKLGQVEDVVHAVLYLSSPLAAMTTGHSLLVDGGWTAH